MYSSPSFYVADDEKSIAVIDILEYMKSKDITFQFYLNLLQDLTDMIAEVEPSKNKFPGKETEDEPLITVKHSDSYDDVAIESAKEKQALQLQSLLDMESELEDAMCKIRKRMMVIRMIGLMSEDDALKDSLLQNSGKMIEVCLASQFFQKI